MNDEEAQMHKILGAEIEALDVRYETLKEYLAGQQIDDLEIIGVLRAFKDNLSTISSQILTLYQLKGQRAKITWDSLFTNIDTALDAIQNSPRVKPRDAIKTALKMSEPTIEEVM
ncbi:MAG: hypothetical protein ACM3WQ_00485, partial [Chloroflexota bacterium]